MIVIFDRTHQRLDFDHLNTVASILRLNPISNIMILITVILTTRIMLERLHLVDITMLIRCPKYKDILLIAPYLQVAKCLTLKANF